MGNRSTSLAPVVIGDLTKNTHFSASELNDLYKQYRYDCNQRGNGLKLTMSMNKFKKIYDEIFPEGDSTKFAEHVFQTWDQDHNGVIDFKEFVTLLNTQMNGTFEDKVTWLFDLYDCDKSEEISYDEAYEAISDLFDLNSGFIPAEESFSPKQLTECLFQKANEHRNGHVDRQFFYNVVMQDQTFLDLLEATAQCASHPFKLQNHNCGSSRYTTGRRSRAQTFNSTMSYKSRTSSTLSSRS